MVRPLRPYRAVVMLSAVCSIFFAGWEAIYGADLEASPSQQQYKTVVAPFVKTYCIRCHGSTIQKGNLRLDTLSPGFGRGVDISAWLRVRSRLLAGDMPPKRAPQPPKKQRQQIVSWLNDDLARARRTVVPPAAPFLGNQVDHELLFDPKLAGLATASPERSWRISSEIYYRLLVELDPPLKSWWERKKGFKLLPEFGEKLSKFTAAYSDPFVANGDGFLYYSARFGIDKTTASVLVRNAQTLVAHQTQYSVDKNGRPRFGHNQNLTGPKYHFDGKKEGDPLLELFNPKEKFTTELMQRGIREQFRLAMLREPSEQELARFTALMEKNVKASGREVGVRSTLTAIVLLPEVYFRSEFGAGKVDEYGRRMLAPREVAFAVAFALTDLRPDAELLKAAKEGRLDSRDEVATQVQRILADSRIEKPRILRFFRQYFGYIHALEAFKDAKTVSTFERKFGIGKSERSRHFRYVPKAFVNDTDNLVEYVLQKDRNVLRELLTTNKTFVNWNEENPKKMKFGYAGFSWIEPVYNLTKWPGSKQPIELPGDQRAGVLTQPSWLIAHSFNNWTQPIHRGKWIRQRLLGQDLPPVPLDVNATVPPDPKKTMRQKLTITRQSRCWVCHQRMDPLGLPLEMFDHFGRFRSQELSKPVDTSGRITASGEERLDGDVKDGIALLRKLAGSDRVRQVFVRHAFRYWMGRAETLADAPTLLAADTAYVKSGGSMKALIGSLLTSDAFLYRVLAGHYFASSKTPLSKEDKP